MKSVYDPRSPFFIRVETQEEVDQYASNLMMKYEVKQIGNVFLIQVWPMEVHFVTDGWKKH